MATEMMATEMTNSKTMSHGIGGYSTEENVTLEDSGKSSQELSQGFL